MIPDTISQTKDLSRPATPSDSLQRVLGIARFELRRSRNMLMVAAVLLALLSCLALISGVIQQRHQATNARLIQAEQSAYLARQRAKVVRRVGELTAAKEPLSPDTKLSRNPAYLAQHGTPAIQPQGPLAAYSVGLTPLQPQSVQVTLADPALLEAKENLQHPLQLWTGHFDLSFVLVYLLPLLLIGLSFDLTAGEQHSGNLKMLLVQGGNLRVLVAGKLLARGVALAGMLVLLTGLAWAAAQLQSQPFAWGRWSLTLAFALCYGGVWIGLAALLNARRWQAATIAAALAAAWLLSAWLIPGVSQQLLQTAVPVPSRISYIQQHREASERVRQESSRKLGKYMEDHPELAGGAGNDYAMLQLYKEEAMARAIRPVVLAYEQRLQRQQGLAHALQYLSPAALFEDGLSQIAGSGDLRQHDYRRQVAAFQADWKAYFLPLIQQNQALMPADYDRLPVFDYHEPRLRELTGHLLPQLLFLALLAAALLGLSLRAYGRYQIIEVEP